MNRFLDVSETLRNLIFRHFPARHLAIEESPGGRFLGAVSIIGVVPSLRGLRTSSILCGCVQSNSREQEINLMSVVFELEGNLVKAGIEGSHEMCYQCSKPY